MERARGRVRVVANEILAPLRAEASEKVNICCLHHHHNPSTFSIHLTFAKNLQLYTSNPLRRFHRLEFRDCRIGDKRDFARGWH